MATFPRTSPFALATALIALGCTSNPTPHPGNSDTGSQPDVFVPSDEAQRTVCDRLGGYWSEDESVCTQVDQGFEADAGSAAPPEGPPAADIVGIELAGSDGDFSFTVLIASDDVDCGQYADWWEIVRVDGSLAYRDVLAGPHLTDQPFTRTAEHVAIDADTLVLVRAHLHPAGYVGVAWVGSPEDGFTAARVSETFAGEAAQADPQPPTCSE